MRNGPALLLVVGTILFPGANADADQLLFANGFEAGHLCFWSTATSFSGCAIPPPSLFLINLTSGYPDVQTFTSPFATFLLDVPATGVTDVTHFCVKRSSSSPTADDDCWRQVPGTPTPGLDLTGEPVRLGFLPGVVTLYAFVRDEVGKVSILLPEVDGRGKDHARVSFEPGEPPTASNFWVTTTPDACPDFSAADLDTSTSSDLYFRWNAGFPNFPVSNNPVQIDYTTDDVTFTELPGSPFPNGVTGDCQLSTCGPVFTGCLALSGHSLPSTYLRFRIRATDAKGLVTVRSAWPPLNVGDSFRFIAGNPDPGIDGSATATVFNNGVTNASFFTDSHSLAVSTRGDVYFLDPTNGVLWVDPETGLGTRVAPTTGVAQDGSLSGPTPATFKEPSAIFMTHENEVLVWDGSSIRRIGLDPGGKPSHLETVIGTPPGCDFPECPCWECSIVALPGGDFYFANGLGQPGPSGWRIFRYSGGVIDTIVPSGVGYSQDSAVQIQNCQLYGLLASYDSEDGSVRRLHAGVFPQGDCSDTGYGYVSMDAAGVSVTTSEPAAPHLYTFPIPGNFYFTGLDGFVYQYWESVKYGLVRYDDESNTLQNVLRDFDTPTVQSCPELVHPKNCHPRAHDAFVDRYGSVYWSSVGKIRTIDFGADGQDSFGPATDVSGFDDKVVDLYGQSLDYGENGDALDARIAFASTLNLWNDGVHDRVSYVDNVNAQIREATVGQNVVRRAGNGVVGFPTAGAQNAADEPFWANAEASYLQDTDGTIYWRGNGEILSNTGPASPWQRLVGQGSTPYWDEAADGLPGNQIQLGFYEAFPFGLTPNRVLFAPMRLDFGLGLWADGMVKSYAKSDGTQLHIAGLSGPVGPTCADGTLRTECGLNLHYYGWARTRPFFDALHLRWIVQESPFANSFMVFDDDGDGGPPGALKSSLGGPLFLSGYLRSWSYRYEAGDDILYVCTSDGRLARAVRDGTNWSITNLPWPIDSLECSGQDLVWSSDGKRILFPYRFLGLGGIAAYVVDP